MESILAIVAVASVLAGAACAVLGAWHGIKELKPVADARKAIGAGAAESAQQTGLSEQAGYDKAFEALAKLAAALRDLDRSGRYFVLALAFFAVASLAGGVQEVSDAIAGST